ncbi:MAG: hypothetical protein U9R68_10220 [Planctomycetota bacterium]|nr:hypothetical protein [Planctomycetota bacterium]
MRRYGLALLTGVLGGLLVAGCWYERPDLEQRFAILEVGMTRDEVIEQLGQPTHILGDTILGDTDDPQSEQKVNELFYLYDDPDDPVRFRIVLDARDVVIRKFYETKPELAKQAEAVKGEIPPIQLVPGEEERGYPGGPLERFEEQTKKRRL